MNSDVWSSRRRSCSGVPGDRYPRGGPCLKKEGAVGAATVAGVEANAKNAGELIGLL